MGTSSTSLKSDGDLFEIALQNSRHMRIHWRGVIITYHMDRLGVIEQYSRQQKRLNAQTIGPLGCYWDADADWEVKVFQEFADNVWKHTLRFKIWLVQELGLYPVRSSIFECMDMPTEFEKANELALYAPLIATLHLRQLVESAGIGATGRHLYRQTLIRATQVF